MVGGDLDQFDGTRAPVAERLDPEAGATLVDVGIILVTGEVAFALQESEAARGVVDKSVGAQLAGIVQGAPDALAGPRPDGEAVTIVNPRMPVGGAVAVMLAEPVHGHERGYAETLDRAAEVEFRLDFHDHAAFVPHVEAIGAGQAGALQQRIDDYLSAVLRGSLHPEAGKVREFLFCVGESRVYGDRACGNAVLIFLAGGAEVGSAE